MAATTDVHDFALRWFEGGGAWCTTCHLPVIASEIGGYQHATTGHPFGDPGPADHRIDTEQWWAARRERQGGDPPSFPPGFQPGDRYAVIEVNLTTGQPRKIRDWYGDEGADLAHVEAGRRTNERTIAWVVALR